MRVRKTSWHYRMINHVYPTAVNDHTTGCEYVFLFILSAATVTALSIAVVFIMKILGTTLGELIAAIVNNYYSGFSKVAEIVIASVIGAIGFVVSFLVITLALQKCDIVDFED